MVNCRLLFILTFSCILVITAKGDEFAFNKKKLLLSMGIPVPVDRANIHHLDEFSQTVRRIKTALPQTTTLHIGFSTKTTTKDWHAFLDVAHKHKIQLIISFAEIKKADEGGHYRPIKTGKEWDFGALGEFVSDKDCITHPALYALFTVDEPWHQKKKPFYSGDDLKEMYRELKSLAPKGTDFRILLQFSRMLWKFIKKDPKPGVYWDQGMADVVQISALELQDHHYNKTMLDRNHHWSRKIIHEKTPTIPLWTSVQTMGHAYGPAKGHWFPRERKGHHDLQQLLNDILSPHHEAIHPLTGIMFQDWDSPSVAVRKEQYRLGDLDKSGKTVPQHQAAEEARHAIRAWLKADKIPEEATDISTNLPPEIFNHWIHVHDDDQKGMRVFRPQGYKLPPSRGRIGFEINKEGNFIYHDIGRGDGIIKIPGKWKNKGKKIKVTFPGTNRKPLVLIILECEKEILKIKQ